MGIFCGGMYAEQGMIFPPVWLERRTPKLGIIMGSVECPETYYWFLERICTNVES
jgi:hypothetical protein